MVGRQAGGDVTQYQHCQVVTTTDSRAAADALSLTAVQARVAACAQVVGPITSTYWWHDKIETADEWQVIFKTTTERYPALARHIGEHHGYEVPEIVCTPVTAGNPAYLSWVSAQTLER
jgi:periplasmic divalent cation tolerance protein